MTKLAHLVSRPGHQIGDRVLGLCEKKFTVKVLWADIPADKPICRKCVDVAVEALTEADTIIQKARIDQLLLEVRLQRGNETLNPEGGLVLDGIAERDQDHQEAVKAKAWEKAELKKAKRTCTCTWKRAAASGEPRRQTDPDCPIHSHLHADAIGVEIEDVQLPPEVTE